MELNGIANILMILEAWQEAGCVGKLGYEALVEQAILTEKYLVALQYVPDLKWHEVRCNAELFPRNSKSNGFEDYVEFLNQRSKS